MTGGDIYNSIMTNPDMREAYMNDEMYRDQIDKLIQAADIGDVEVLADSITYMAFNFLSIYNSFINIISQSNDPETIERANSLLRDYCDYLDT